MSDIEFVAEVPDPQAGRYGRLWADVIEKLQADPGRWAIVRRWPKTSGAPQTGSAEQARLKARGCEATVRSVGDERRLYARWPEDAS